MEFVTLTPLWMKCDGTSGHGNKNGDRYQLDLHYQKGLARFQAKDLTIDSYFDGILP